MNTDQWWSRTLLGLLVGTIFTGPLPVFAKSRLAVELAASRLYVHGITKDVALAEVGYDGVPHLLDLLADPNFARRDNVVSFLLHLGSAETTPKLVELLEAPPADVTRPEEDRALLVAPHALGQIAERGDDEALTALLRITGRRGSKRLLARARRNADQTRQALRDDLVEMAIMGLAASKRPEARERLRAFASGEREVRLNGRDIKRRAAVALDRLEGLKPRALNPGRNNGASLQALDINPTQHSSALTWGLHPDVPDPMTETRLDQVLQDASLRMGREDFPGDVACCASIRRSGSAVTIGWSGDGLDVIEDSEEYSAVGSFGSYANVVRLIQFCGVPYPGGVLGCGGGSGMTMIRLSNLGYEAVLWAHEFGHAAGLPHHPDTNNIMFAAANQTDAALDQPQCTAYHSWFGADPGDTCADSDGDLVHDGVDNCPTVANFAQADSDGDGFGDSCDTCGDTVVDAPDEECDDGNADDGDGCRNNCKFNICGDGSVYSGVEECDETDSDELDYCKTNCTLNVCGDGLLNIGVEECDDGNVAPADGCSPSCTIDCQPAPVAGCQLQDASGKGILKMRLPPSGKDIFLWKWKTDTSTSPVVFGDPGPGNTGVFRLCMYDSGGLVFGAGVPADGPCKSDKPCWKETGSGGARYVDRDLTPDGVKLLKLGRTSTGKLRIKAKLQGPIFDAPAPLSLASPIIVQLHTPQAHCFESTFTAPFKKLEPSLLKDKAD